jgi:hypothetical protein
MCGFGSTGLHKKKMRAMCFREMVGQCLVWERDNSGKDFQKKTAAKQEEE